MKKYYFRQLDSASFQNLCQRKAINFDDLLPVVENVLRKVKTWGDGAVREFTAKFDNVSLSSLTVTEKEIEQAAKRIPQDVQSAFQKATANIEKFHKSQLIKRKKVETMTGVNCFTEARPIEKVGLYIPGGTAPLPSTVLMLAIPAKLAGCKEIVLVTPPTKEGNVADIILFTAQMCGITKIFKIGGAQAIAALAFGTETVPKVYKIFGPGNQYVTAAKMLVSIDPNGTAIDIPAGPTEVLIIADEKARADFVTSDLLSQAEHGIDSQAILVTTSDRKADEILDEVRRQIENLPRKEIAQKSLGNSFIIIVNSIDEAIFFSNQYAPEHLILNVINAKKHIPSITNAGSVFLGAYSCESAGDYASGTNHCLPTYGYARVFGGVSVSSFQKQITFQKITKQGAKNLGPIVSVMASQESLEGHKRAMELRYKKSKQQKYAFLDRDGTLIFEPQDTYQIDSLAKLKILDGVIAGLKKLKKAGYSLIMVSNQDGLGTASFPQKNFEAPHKKMLKIFRYNGISFDKIFICPHFPNESCNCRKPKIGLVEEFLRTANIDKLKSFVCGNRDSDRQFAENIGIKFIPMETNGNFYKSIKPFLIKTI